MCINNCCIEDLCNQKKIKKIKAAFRVSSHLSLWLQAFHITNTFNYLFEIGIQTSCVFKKYEITTLGKLFGQTSLGMKSMLCIKLQSLEKF